MKAGCLIKVGDRFGRWHVISAVPKLKPGGHNLWRCKCECGQLGIVQAATLRNGRSRSCGCYAGKVSTTHGQTKTPEYKSWCGMKERCLNSRATGFKRYGGRGIQVCDRWLTSFENFLADMGRRPSVHHTLDRLDNNGHYEPSNCQWATASQQASNRRSTRFITFQHKRLPLKAWCKLLDIRYSTTRDRLERGWPIHEAFSHPARMPRKTEVSC